MIFFSQYIVYLFYVKVVLHIIDRCRFQVPLLLLGTNIAYLLTVKEVINFDQFLNIAATVNTYLHVWLFKNGLFKL
ncbi:MAG: hypothetical protein ACI9ES_002182 [Oceanospirillaceae bacterium]|jgi:hypothetical protein